MENNLAPQNIEIRVSRLKRQFESLAKDPEHSFTVEPVNRQTLAQLRTQEYYPYDMMLILDQIGCMSNWGHREFGMLQWWTPCSIECALETNKCIYELSNSNFLNPSSLLFFASDCNANCYFYDTTVRPWKVVVCDDLELSLYNLGNRSIVGWDGRVRPWVEEGDINALSIIERFAFAGFGNL